VPIPPGADCAPSATKCQGDAQQTCGSDGTWGAAVACEIGCDGAGSACVVPVQMAAGFSTCARLSDGTVRCWGSDDLGELGNGPGGGSIRPSEVPGLSDVTDISSNLSNTCALLGDKTARCWGSNSYRQIASAGDVAPSPTPVGSVGVTRVSASGSHLCLLSDDGEIRCRGANFFGQLGNNSTQDSVSFVSPQGFSSTLTDVQTASTHSCALLSNGEVSCWGAGEYRNGTTTEKTTPTKVPGVGNVVQLSLGSIHSCAVRDDGAVLCWGSNYYGNLGRGSLSFDGQAPGVVVNLGGVEAVSLGVRHGCATKKDRTMWCWGANEFDQLGGSCGQIGTCQNNSDRPYIASPVKVPLENVVEAVVGDGFTCARTDERKMYCWGKNDAGQLGINKVSSKESTPTPVVWK
jgi:alpha-tubulin suppressor-like RCC1 family protein